MHWRKKWQPTPAFLHGESQGQRRLVNCRLWGRTESARLKRLCSSSNRQVCPSLCDPMDCSLPVSSFRGIFQARILEWVAISFAKSVSRYCQISSGVQAHSQSITVDLKWRKWEECWEWMEFIMNFLLINISHLYCWSGWTLHSGSNTF